MTGAAWCLLAVTVLAAALAVGYSRRRERQLTKRLGDMLDAALSGTFTELRIDETALSAVESRMVRYLAAGATAAGQLATERDRIHALIADISHQTKTPIANLLLYAQLLEEEDLSPEGRVATEALRTQAEKLRFLTDSLVKLSRLEAGVIAVVPKEQPVRPLVEAVAAQIAPRAETRGIALTVETADAGLTALFDAKWTAEALYNLADNAVKYTNPGGSVRLSATGYQFFCRIDVTDTGPGIPEGEHSKIFARFYRSPTVADREGVGIGLFLTRQIAVAEGGYVKVRSKPGAGSTFSLFLPRSGGSVPHDASPDDV